MLAESVYTIQCPKSWFLRDKPKEKYSRNSSRRENLLFHIKEGDYFGTLATVLSLIREQASGSEISEKMRQWELRALSGASDDLMFLQKNYRITPKNDD